MSDVSWWQNTEPKVAEIARKVALRHTGRDPETPSIAYEPHRVDTPSGGAWVVTLGELRPLWTYYIGVARLALEAADHSAVDDVLSDAAPVRRFTDATVTPPTPDQQWRRETGLDEGSEEDGPTAEGG